MLYAVCIFYASIEHSITKGELETKLILNWIPIKSQYGTDFSKMGARRVLPTKPVPI